MVVIQLKFDTRIKANGVINEFHDEPPTLSAQRLVRNAASLFIHPTPLVRIVSPAAEATLHSIQQVCR